MECNEGGWYDSPVSSTSTPRRIYLTGHSMGGSGTYFLGSKRPDV